MGRKYFVPKRHQPLIGDFRDVMIRRESEFLKIELSDQSQ